MPICAIYAVTILRGRTSKPGRVKLIPVKKVFLRKKIMSKAQKWRM